jgi:hypothetical protein
MTPTLITTLEREIESRRHPALPSIPENVTAAKALIVAESSQLIVATVGQNARAIVLTGSMSRGETTLQKEGPIWRVLGDATFLIIFDGTVELNTAKLEQEIQDSLFAKGVSCKVVIVTSTAGNLRAMKPHIYAYELKERGVVVWGDQNALSLIPAFGAADIPKEDGWWLLCNRMIEQIEVAAASDTFNDDCTAVRYRIAKLYLAMSACYLLVIGRYEPSYQSRASRLKEIAENSQSALAPLPIGRFSEVVSRCTELKLHGETDVLLRDFPRWRDAVADAEVIWRWALTEILELNLGLSRKALIGALASRQSVRTRAKGWLRAAISHRSGLGREGFRWAGLALSSSPRYLVYGAASELFFMTQEPAATNRDQFAAVVQTVPISLKGCNQDLTWNTVAKQVAHNFHALLENNRC